MTKKLRNLLLIATTAFCFCLLFAVGIKADAAGSLVQTGQTTTSVTFQWTPYYPSYSVYQIDNYEVTWKKYGSDTVKSGTLDPGYVGATLSNISTGSLYYVTVKENYRYAINSNIYSSSYIVGSGYLCTTPGGVSGLVEKKWTDSGYLTLNWNAMAGDIDGYHYQIFDDATGKCVKANANRYTNLYEKLSLKNGYRIRVRAYIKNGLGNTVYGAWSPYQYILPQPKLTYKLLSGRKVKISWSRVNKASKYVIYMSKSQSSGYKKVATIKQTKKTKKTISKTFSSFKKKKFALYKNYYVRVYVYKKMGGTTRKTLITHLDGFYIH